MPALQDVEMTEDLRISFASTGFAEKTSSRQLKQDFAEIAEAIAIQLDKGSLLLLNSSTVEEFAELRKELFPRFVRLSEAFSNLALAAIPPTQLARINQDALEETGKEFIAKAASYLSEDAYNEALFSISTLQSAQKLILKLIPAKPRTPSDEEEDQKLAEKYFHSAVWARMHLNCLILAIQKSLPIREEILQELLDGMRASVMAYSYVRSAFDLRTVLDSRYQEGGEISWDDEDQALANAE